MGSGASSNQIPLDLRYGSSCMQGMRPYQEDRVFAVHPCPPAAHKNDRGISFFGVYDGHGGGWVADFCQKSLHQFIAKQKEYTGPNKHVAISKGFLRCDDAILSDPEAHRNINSGATAVVAVIDKEYLYVGNVGDSRCVLYRDGSARLLTNDHKPTDAAEHKRIVAAGGTVANKYVELEDRGLAVSRALGDGFFKRNTAKSKTDQVVVALPHLTRTRRTASDHFLLLATDGLWNVMTEEEACKYVVSAREQLREENEQEYASGERNELDDVCSALTQRALDLRTRDNVSVLLVVFGQGAVRAASSACPQKPLTLPVPLSPAAPSAPPVGREGFSTYPPPRRITEEKKMPPSTPHAAAEAVKTSMREGAKPQATSLVLLPSAPPPTPLPR